MRKNKYRILQNIVQNIGDDKGWRNIIPQRCSSSDQPCYRFNSRILCQSGDFPNKSLFWIPFLNQFLERNLDYCFILKMRWGYTAISNLVGIESFNLSSFHPSPAKRSKYLIFKMSPNVLSGPFHKSILRKKSRWFKTSLFKKSRLLIQR